MSDLSEHRQQSVALQSHTELNRRVQPPDPDDGEKKKILAYRIVRFSNIRLWQRAHNHYATNRE